MNKKDFKVLKEEDKIIAFNQLKDDYNILFEKDFNKDKEIERLNNELELQNIEMSREIERLKGEKESLNSLVNRCQREIRRLNNIINKALELIYDNAYDTERKACIDDLWGNIEELVDILKGSDKE